MAKLRNSVEELQRYLDTQIGGKTNVISLGGGKYRVSITNNPMDFGGQKDTLALEIQAGPQTPFGQAYLAGTSGETAPRIYGSQLSATVEGTLDKWTPDPAKLSVQARNPIQHLGEYIQASFDYAHERRARGEEMTPQEAFRHVSSYGSSQRGLEGKVPITPYAGTENALAAQAGSIPIGITTNSPKVNLNSAMRSKVQGAIQERIFQQSGMINQGQNVVTSQEQGTTWEALRKSGYVSDPKRPGVIAPGGRVQEVIETNAQGTPIGKKWVMVTPTEPGKAVKQQTVFQGSKQVTGMWMKTPQGLQRVEAQEITQGHTPFVAKLNALVPGETTPREATVQHVLHSPTLVPGGSVSGISDLTQKPYVAGVESKLRSDLTQDLRLRDLVEGNVDLQMNEVNNRTYSGKAVTLGKLSGNPIIAAKGQQAFIATDNPYISIPRLINKTTWEYAAEEGPNVVPGEDIAKQLEARYNIPFRATEVEQIAMNVPGVTDVGFKSRGLGSKEAFGLPTERMGIDFQGMQLPIEMVSGETKSGEVRFEQAIMSVRTPEQQRAILNEYDPRLAKRAERLGYFKKYGTFDWETLTDRYNKMDLKENKFLSHLQLSGDVLKNVFQTETDAEGKRIPIDPFGQKNIRNLKEFEAGYVMSSPGNETYVPYGPMHKDITDYYSREFINYQTQQGMPQEQAAAQWEDLFKTVRPGSDISAFPQAIQQNIAQHPELAENLTRFYQKISAPSFYSKEAVALHPEYTGQGRTNPDMATAAAVANPEVAEAMGISPLNPMGQTRSARAWTQAYDWVSTMKSMEEGKPQELEGAVNVGPEMALDLSTRLGAIPNDAKDVVQQRLKAIQEVTGTSEKPLYFPTSKQYMMPTGAINALNYTKMGRDIGAIGHRATSIIKALSAGEIGDSGELRKAENISTGLLGDLDKLFSSKGEAMKSIMGRTSKGGGTYARFSYAFGLAPNEIFAPPQMMRKMLSSSGMKGAELREAMQKFEAGDMSMSDVATTMRIPNINRASAAQAMRMLPLKEMRTRTGMGKGDWGRFLKSATARNTAFFPMTYGEQNIADYDFDPVEIFRQVAKKSGMGDITEVDPVATRQGLFRPELGQKVSGLAGSLGDIIGGVGSSPGGASDPMRLKAQVVSLQRYAEEAENVKQSKIIGMGSTYNVARRAEAAMAVQGYAEEDITRAVSQTAQLYQMPLDLMKQYPESAGMQIPAMFSRASVGETSKESGLPQIQAQLPSSGSDIGYSQKFEGDPIQQWRTLAEKFSQSVLVEKSGKQINYKPLTNEFIGSMLQTGPGEYGNIMKRLEGAETPEQVRSGLNQYLMQDVLGGQFGKEGSGALVQRVNQQIAANTPALRMLQAAATNKSLNDPDMKRRELAGKYLQLQGPQNAEDIQATTGLYKFLEQKSVLPRHQLQALANRPQKAYALENVRSFMRGLSKQTPPTEPEISIGKEELTTNDIAMQRFQAQFQAAPLPGVIKPAPKTYEKIYEEVQKETQLASQVDPDFEDIGIQPSPELSPEEKRAKLADLHERRVSSEGGGGRGKGPGVPTDTELPLSQWSGGDSGSGGNQGGGFGEYGDPKKDRWVSPSTARRAVMEGYTEFKRIQKRVPRLSEAIANIAAESGHAGESVNDTIVRMTRDPKLRQSFLEATGAPGLRLLKQAKASFTKISRAAALMPYLSPDDMLEEKAQLSAGAGEILGLTGGLSTVSGAVTNEKWAETPPEVTPLLQSLENNPEMQQIVQQIRASAPEDRLKTARAIVASQPGARGLISSARAAYGKIPKAMREEGNTPFEGVAQVARFAEAVGIEEKGIPGAQKILGTGKLTTFQDVNQHVEELNKAFAKLTETSKKLEGASGENREALVKELALRKAQIQVAETRSTLSTATQEYTRAFTEKGISPEMQQKAASEYAKAQSQYVGARVTEEGAQRALGRKMDEGEEGGPSGMTGSFARRALGGWGLMYLKTIGSYMTAPITGGYDESQKEQALYAQGMGKAMGVAPETSIESRLARLRGTMLGGSGALVGQQFQENILRTDPTAYRNAQMGFGALSAFGAAQWLGGMAGWNPQQQQTASSVAAISALALPIAANAYGALSDTRGSSVQLAARQQGGAGLGPASYLANAASFGTAGFLIGGVPGAAIGAGIGAVTTPLTDTSFWAGFNSDAQRRSRQLQQISSGNYAPQEIARQAGITGGAASQLYTDAARVAGATRFKDIGEDLLVPTMAFAGAYNIQASDQFVQGYSGALAAGFDPGKFSSSFFRSQGKGSDWFTKKKETGSETWLSQVSDKELQALTIKAIQNPDELTDQEREILRNNGTYTEERKTFAPSAMELMIKATTTGLQEGTAPYQERVTSLETGAGFLAQVGATRYMKPATTEEEATRQAKILEQAGQLKDSSAGEIYAQKHQAWQQAARLGMRAGPEPQVADFMKGEAPKEYTPIQKQMELLTTSAQVQQQSAVEQFRTNYAGQFAQMGMQAPQAAQLATNISQLPLPFAAQMMGRSPVMLGNLFANQSTANLGNISLPSMQMIGQAPQYQGLNANWLGMTNMVQTDQGQYASSLKYGTTSWAMGNRSADSMAQQWFGKDYAKNDILAKSVSGYQLQTPISLPNGQTISQVGGQMAIQWQQQDEAYRAQQASAALAMKGNALQFAFTTGVGLGGYGGTVNPQTGQPFGFNTGAPGFNVPGAGQFQSQGGGIWGYEDAQRALGYAQQEYGFGSQQRSMDMSKQFFFQNMGMQQRQTTLQRGWQQQDWAVDASTREMQWGWKQEDFQEQNRFQTGRQRRLGERQMRRETQMHDIEEERIETSKDRQKTLWQLEDQRFEIQKEQFTKQHQFQQEELDMSKRFYGERKRLETEAQMLQRAFWIENEKLQRQAAAAQAAYAKRMHELEEAMRPGELAIALAADQVANIGEQALPALAKGIDALIPKIKELLQPWFDLAGLDMSAFTNAQPIYSSSGSVENVPGSGGYVPGAPSDQYTPPKPQQPGGIVKREASGGDLGNAGSVGEEGYEMVINGTVIPHDISMKLSAMGVRPPGANSSFNSVSNTYSQFTNTVLPGSAAQAPKTPQIVNVYLGNERLGQFVLDTVDKDIHL